MRSRLFGVDSNPIRFEKKSELNGERSKHLNIRAFLTVRSALLVVEESYIRCLYHERGERERERGKPQHDSLWNVRKIRISYSHQMIWSSSQDHECSEREMERVEIALVGWYAHSWSSALAAIGARHWRAAPRARARARDRRECSCRGTFEKLPRGIFDVSRENSPRPPRFLLVRHEGQGCRTVPLRARRHRRIRGFRGRDGTCVLASAGKGVEVSRVIIGVSDFRRVVAGRNSRRSQHHGDERAVRGDRQGLRSAVLRDVRWPGAEAEPHKHVQRKTRTIPLDLSICPAASVARLSRHFPARYCDLCIRWLT